MPAESDVLALPPLPLATGTLLVPADGPALRVSTIALVVTTEDGDESRLKLQQRHGAWWPPAAPFDING